MLLGAARYLAATRRFAGTVVLIFQPAEEGKAGARAMIEDGMLDRYPFGRVFALHNVPGMPAAEIAASPGAVMAAVDKFDVTVTGKGGHAAMPHLNRDPVLAASALVVALQSIVSRSRDPGRPAVVTITRFNAGEADNATPGRATLRGNVRFLEADGSAVFRDHIERIARGIAETYGVSVDVDYVVGRPPTVNAETEAQARARGGGLAGANRDGRSQCRSPIMASEDFSYFLKARPGAFAFLGAGEGRPSLHSSDYDFNDAILVTRRGVPRPACRAGAAWLSLARLGDDQICRSARAPRKRLTHDERKALILDRAADYLSENGFPVRTRRLAAAAGISQRLIYHFFPNKSALIDEIYDSAIQGPFKAIWFVELADRSKPVADRLRAFYRDYFDTLLTRRWTRLLVYSSFSEQNMAPRYISGIILRLLETIVEEVAAERGVKLPAEKPVVHEIGWILHGAVSHLAIRRHLFHANVTVPVDLVLDAQINSFLAGFEPMLDRLRKRPRPKPGVGEGTRRASPRKGGRH